MLAGLMGLAELGAHVASSRTTRRHAVSPGSGAHRSGASGDCAVGSHRRAARATRVDGAARARRGLALRGRCRWPVRATSGRAGSAGRRDRPPGAAIAEPEQVAVVPGVAEAPHTGSGECARAATPPGPRRAGEARRTRAADPPRSHAPTSSARSFASARSLSTRPSGRTRTVRGGAAPGVERVGSPGRSTPMWPGKTSRPVASRRATGSEKLTTPRTPSRAGQAEHLGQKPALGVGGRAVRQHEPPELERLLEGLQLGEGPGRAPPGGRGRSGRRRRAGRLADPRGRSGGGWRRSCAA